MVLLQVQHAPVVAVDIAVVDTAAAADVADTAVVVLVAEIKVII